MNMIQRFVISYPPTTQTLDDLYLLASSRALLNE